MSRTLLIADTNELNREILAGLFEDQYQILETADGTEALDLIRKGFQDMAGAILDAALPEVDGIMVCDAIKKQEWGFRIPIMILSDDAIEKTKKRAYEAGAAYFSGKPFDSELIKNRLTEMIDLYDARLVARSGVKGEKSAPSVDNLPAGVAHAGKMFDAVIDFVGRLVESRDPENKNHIYRIKGLVKIMCRKMQELYPEYDITDAKMKLIVVACSIHDIGKVGIPDSIILKPGRLTDEEYEAMKSHTLRGVELFDEIDFEWDEEFRQTAKEIIRSHHEKYDGGGYPDGLKGDDIPMSAQIVSLADTYDALVNDRIYRKAFSKEQAYNMIVGGDTGVFPPRIIECFKACREELENWENGTTKEV